MAVDTRYAVAHRRGEPKPFVLRVFGKGEVIFTSGGSYRLVDGAWKGPTDVQILSIHDKRADALAEL